MNCLTDIERKRLIKIIKTKYINFYTFLNEIDPNHGEAFIQKNTSALQIKYQKHQNKNDEIAKRKEKIMFHFYFSPDKMTRIEKVLYEESKSYKINDLLPKFLEELSVKFFNIKKSGIKDGLQWNEDVEKEVITGCLKAYISKEFFGIVKKRIKTTDSNESKAPMLWANPTNFKPIKGISKGFFPQTLLQNLSEKDFCLWECFIDNDLDFWRMLKKEVKLLDHENKFEKIYEQESLRNDKILNLHISHLDSKQFPKLYFILAYLYSFPFELNERMKWYLQVSETASLSIFNAGGTHAMHWDNQFDKHDNGISLSILYYIGSEDSKKTLKINLKDGKEREVQVEMKKNSVLIIKSRILAMSIDAKYKSQVLRYWVYGPEDPKKQF